MTKKFLTLVFLTTVAFGCGETPMPTDSGPLPDSSFMDDAGMDPMEDADTPEPDAGMPEPDAGTDAGMPDPDAGTPEPDAGMPEPDAGPEPECALDTDCAAAAACHESRCVEGMCQTVTQPDGEGCDDGDACTVGDECRAGVCAGAEMDCSPLDTMCVSGVCDPALGFCVNDNFPDGTVCDDGISTTVAACSMGLCESVGCAAGLGDCDMSAGCETALDTVDNCGACGATCGVDCDAGACDTVVDMSLGAYTGSVCLVLRSGRVACSPTTRLSFLETSIFGSVVSMDSYRHRCHVEDATGNVFCTGRNDYGQIGNGTTTNTSGPVSASGLTDAVDVSVNVVHSCAVLDDGTVWCWGGGGFGQLGQNSAANSSVPLRVGTFTNIVQVSTGNSHTCALDATGQAHCWGAAGARLGRTDSMSNRVPGPVAGVSNAVAIHSGSAHTCALLDSGTVRCWGVSNSGQVGPASSYPTATTIPLPGPATDLAVGDNHSCAIVSGEAFCWGFNHNGVLGAPTPSSSATPLRVLGVADARAIWSKAWTTCVVEGDGHDVVCWGLNLSAPTAYDPIPTP